MIIIPKLLTDFAEFLKHCSLFTLVYSTHPPESVFDTIQQQLVISSPIQQGSQSLSEILITYMLRDCFFFQYLGLSVDTLLCLVTHLSIRSSIN